MIEIFYIKYFDDYILNIRLEEYMLMNKKWKICALVLEF